MNETYKIIANLISAAGGEMIGKVRLQKAMYLLAQKGLVNDTNYEYYYYGPYSRDVDLALNEAIHNRFINEEQKNRALDGARYSIFKIAPDFEPFESDAIEYDELITWGEKFAKTNSTVLELAATIHWIKEKEKIEDWQREIKLRKGSKTEKGKLEEAISFLKENKIMETI